MTAAVVDTNVIATANGTAYHAPDNCVLAAIDALGRLREQGVIALDDGQRILKEYLRHASRSGQPGVGDAFVRHVLDNLYNTAYCLLVSITINSTDDNFAEFPDDPDLAGFDHDDRKFVAVARATNPPARIVNATDTDWWHYREIFARHLVSIDFLCPSLMTDKG